MPDAKNVETWLNFVSTLIWQILLAGIVFYFRSELAALFERIATVKVAGHEFTFQPKSPDAIAPGGEADDEIEILGPEGFFTEKGITRLIEKSRLIGANERVVSSLPLYQTPAQHTWLVATNKQLFCVLDDQEGRVTGKLIQWRMDLDEAHPIKDRPYKSDSGLVDIGKKRNWLYSV